MNESKDIGRRTRVSIFFSSSGRILNHVFVIGTGVVLARLLEPSEFGLMAVVNLVLAFFTRFIQIGLNFAFIQLKEVDERDKSTYFVLDLASKSALVLIVVGCAPLVARYYDQPQLTLLLPLTASGLILDSLGRVPLTLMQRELNYKVTSLIGLAATIGGSIVGVALALLGFGVWSLVWNYLASVIVTDLLVLIFLPWRPSLRFHRDSARRLLDFSKWIFVRNMLNYVAKNVDYFIVSRALGMAPLGFYERAFNLARTPAKMITRPINPVVFSAFSRIQDEKERIRRSFRKVLASVAMVSYPLLLLMIVLADELIVVVYGQKWAPSILPLKIMGVAGIIRSLDPFLNSVITSSGFVKFSALRRGIEAGLLTLGCLIGVRWGILGVSGATVAVSFVMVFVMMQLLRKVSVIRWRDYLQPQVPAALGAVTAAAAAWLVKWQLYSHSFGAAAVLAGAGVIAVLFYLLFVLIFPFDETRQLKKDLRATVADLRGSLSLSGKPMDQRSG